jgi:hypothetical protein
MTKPKEAPDQRTGLDPPGMAEVFDPPPIPQLAMAVWATYKDFRHLLGYVLTEDAQLAIQTVKQMGYFGLDLEAKLVTLLPPRS